MRADDLRVLLQRQPCPVLRLHLTGGMIFELREPDSIVVTHSTVQLLLPANGLSTREAVISLLHVTWVEVVSPPS